MLTLAVAKGKVFDAALPLLRRAGAAPAAADLDTRRLIVDARGLRLIILRGADVATYVSSGAVDAGIVGNDFIEEQDMDDLCVLADLGISSCRLVAAAPRKFDYERAVHENARLSVATKYPRLAREHFLGRGVQIAVVKLHGSMEIAPVTGLADAIVDLADTGRTLRENGLEIKESVMNVSARLVCNIGSLKRLRPQLRSVRKSLLEARP